MSASADLEDLAIPTNNESVATVSQTFTQSERSL